MILYRECSAKYHLDKDQVAHRKISASNHSSAFDVKTTDIKTTDIQIPENSDVKFYTLSDLQFQEKIIDCLYQRLEMTPDFQRSYRYSAFLKFYIGH